MSYFTSYLSTKQSVLRNKRIMVIAFVSFLTVTSLIFANTVVSFMNTTRSVEMSIANHNMKVAKSIAASLDKESYRRFLANPVQNKDYWKIREQLDDARRKIGAMFVYTLLIDNPTVSKTTIISTPEDFPLPFSFGEPCTVPEEQVEKAYDGKSYVTPVIKDERAGDYQSVGVPIKDERGVILGYLGIDSSAQMLEEIKSEVTRANLSTFASHFAVVIILLVCVVLLQKWYRREMKKVVGETESIYRAEFSSFLGSVRSIRHDFINHIQVLYGLLQLQHYPRAMDYMRSLLQEVRMVDVIHPITNPALFVLLQAKLVTAQNKQIDMKLDFDDDPFDRIASTDLIKILSNLIDNAIDAVSELPVEVRKLRITCKKRIGDYLFEVENTGVIAEEHKRNLFTPGVSTKSTINGKARGFGLSIVQHTVQKYAGAIEIISEDGTTSFRITIPVRTGKSK